MQTFCVVILLIVGLVYSQIDLISDPGLFSFSGNQCSKENEWHFRSDYVWNDTSEYINARCAVSFEIPTPVKPGISKGDQTNINKAVIPTLPPVTGGIGGWASSAAVVDMNTACRAALWAPFTLTKDNAASTTIELMLWVRSNDQIQQNLIDGSLVPGAILLQYLPEPDGLLGENLDSFPPEIEETNQVRIDILRPDASGSFYDRAFSLDSSQIVVNIPIPGFTPEHAVPASGTSGRWISVTFDATTALATAGDYALRIASAQSQIGVSWGVTDVHIITKGGARRKRQEVGLYEIESVGEEILGEMTHSIPSRMTSY